ncbi:MAG: aminotransferase class I/II-fold pyridoxal phosphate-dependent enzyme, partial [Clostridia bacterium]|nr:aminotransferase class I/II-fold pyridoxal phosphate-dependent enzyme [Clostridia bacterium]
MRKILYDRILDTNAKVKARFCMPGHSGSGPDGDLFACSSFDWTEVPELDNLLQSDGVILECEKSIASSMGYAHSLMLTQGSSCGMHVAVCVCKDRGQTIAAIGDMHKSFWAACRLYGVESVKFKSEEEFLTADLAGKKIGGVFVTSPDYFGKCRDLSKAREIADGAGALLVVDEAHASHFAYSTLLPDNASAYADISLMSMHKTLPVYGGGAIICLKDDSLRAQCEKYRSLIHSTSPNYLTMASMDYADAYMSERGEIEYERVKKAIDEFEKKLSTGEIIKNDDFTRLVVKVKGADGDAVLQQLAKRGIYAEMAWDDLLVFIVTPFNCDKLDILANELSQMDFSYSGAREKSDESHTALENNFEEKIDYVDIDECLGMVSAEDVGAYPPGIPVLFKGDVIDENKLKYLKKYRNR